MSPNAKADDEVRIEVIDRAEDIVEGFHAVAEAFGRQARDAIWTSLNPGWDDVVSEGGSGGGGRARCASRMVDRWRARTHDRDGNANTVFLKATVPDKEDPQSRVVVVGLAVWVQASFVEGRGEPPEDDLRRAADLDALHPGDEREQRFLAQCYRSLVRRRVEVVREKASSYSDSDSDSDSESDSDPPAVFVLDLCAVDPAYQRRGIASRLVRWGLEEAAAGRRGGGAAGGSRPSRRPRPWAGSRTSVSGSGPSPRSSTRSTRSSGPATRRRTSSCGLEEHQQQEESRAKVSAAVAARRPQGETPPYTRIISNKKNFLSELKSRKQMGSCLVNNRFKLVYNY